LKKQFSLDTDFVFEEVMFWFNSQPCYIKVLMPVFCCETWVSNSSEWLLRMQL